MKTSNKNLDYAILEALRGGSGYSSGEELAKKLKISRQALWKHILNLTEKGYEITAVPHRGYSLVSVPDKFYPEEIKHNLKTKLIARQIHYYDSLGSTQDFGRELGLDGAPEGTVVFAETQKKGKGRLMRKWISPSGGIYFSLLLRPSFFLLGDVSQISLVIALAVIKAIKKATGINCQVKWPNDIILAGKKLGGVLCEINAETDRVNFIVVGVGVNINSKDLPPEATSLLLNTRKKFKRVEIARAILGEIETCYREAKKDSFSSLLKEWSKFCVLWGKRIRVKIFDRMIEGEAQGIDEKGYLLLRSNNGLITKVSAGDIIKVIVN
ncbi:MAG: biotin--[acetyl-CoA-carboxylase] ligase [Candidatus Omnitrophica bacterium]|nr:biotin--[acetyl-CoA-carboxylase] ligase [Candidatus Omnitrophota bacterium]